MRYNFRVFLFSCFLVLAAWSLSAQNGPKFIEGIELSPSGRQGMTPVREVLSATTPVAPDQESASMPVTEQCKTYQFKYAQLLDCEVEQISNTKLFQFIEEWWDTRYRYGGSGKDGIDCSAFSHLLLARVFNFNLPRTSKEQYAVCEKLSRDKMREGDLVFFNTRGGISHVGVYLARGYFVHASTSGGVTINHLDEAYYSYRFLGGGRYQHSEVARLP